MNYINIAACLISGILSAAVSAAVYKSYRFNTDVRLFFGVLAAALVFADVFMVLKSLYWYFDIMYNSVLFVLFLLCMWDVREKQIPAAGVYILFFASSVMMLINPYCGIVNNVITGAAVSLFLFIIYKTGKVSIGLGDAEAIGALAFAFGYPHVFSMLFAGLFLSMLWGIGLMVLKKANMKTEVAFIPFLYAGYVFNILNF